MESKWLQCDPSKIAVSARNSTIAAFTFRLLSAGTSSAEFHGRPLARPNVDPTLAMPAIHAAVALLSLVRASSVLSCNSGESVSGGVPAGLETIVPQIVQIQT